jgi:signal transduction histidine kinase
MKKVFARTLLLSAGLVLGSLILIGLAFSLISYNYVVKEKRQTLEATAKVIAQSTAAFSQGDELDDWNFQIRITMATTATATGAHISICDTQGKVLISSGEDLLFVVTDSYVPEAVINQVYAEGCYSGLTDLGGYFTGKRWVYGTLISSKNNVPLGYVFTAAETADIGEIWRSYAFIFMFAALVVVAVVLPLSVILSKKQARPITEMAQAARTFAKGDLSARVKVKGGSAEVEELKEAFNQMAEALETAEENRRDFVSNVSHELKTPMTTIAGYAQGLLDETIPMTEAKKYLAIIADETHRLSRLVRRMLDLSKMREAGPPKGSFELNETLTRALLSLEAKINAKKLEVELTLPEEEVRVKGDMDSVSQIIYNIIDNGVKFADAGSPLTVRVWKQGTKAYVSITDRGETIPEEDLPHIFQRFHKSDRSRSLDRDGVGLGLYIVKTIIDTMGEDIWVRSQNGETEFVFSLTLNS